MVAAPPMSFFIFSMPSAGLMEIPPVSKLMPLPTSVSSGAPSGSGTVRLVPQHDQRRRLSRPLCHTQERTHLQFLQLCRAVHLAL